MNDKQGIVVLSKSLRKAYLTGLLGDIYFPEEQHPKFKSEEEKLIYFTLPMSLNYRRQSIKLWEAALKTHMDPETRDVFDFAAVKILNHSVLKDKLTKHKLALFKENNTKTWKTICTTLLDNWGTISNLLEKTESDYIKLQQTIQKQYKKGFPYLSGPKIFNYWSLILGLYGGVKLKNRSFIEIAPDTHVIKASVRLGVLTQKEAQTLTRPKISSIWRVILDGSGIDPIDMHPPLWFWSKSGFKYDPLLEK